VKNPISVSSAPIAKLGGKKYFDLAGTIEVMKRILAESVVDGFELQLEPEWDKENPPLTDGQYEEWTRTRKYDVDDIVDLVREEGLPILSVHGSRDIGNYLCATRRKDRERGKRLIGNTVHIAKSLGASICVFHLWDTWSSAFDVDGLRAAFSREMDLFPEVKGSVENIPTHLAGHTPFSLSRSFDFLTLDLRWAKMYRELEAFESLARKIVNIHLHAELGPGGWALDGSGQDFHRYLDVIIERWHYSGLLTVEPRGSMDPSAFHHFVEAMRSIRV